MGRSGGQFGGFLRIAGGTAIGQVVTFFVLPIVSRLYGPEQFGLLSVLLAVSAILLPLSMLGLEQAVLIPATAKETRSVTSTALAALVLVAVVAGIVAWLNPEWFHVTQAERAFVACSLSSLVIASGLSALLTQLAVRNGEYGGIGARNSVQSVTISASQLLLSRLPAAGASNGLVAGNVIGAAVGAGMLLRYARGLLAWPRLGAGIRVIRRFWRFPLVFAPLTAVVLISQQAPVMFSSMMFGAGFSGQVGMAERLVAVPLALLSGAATSVYLGESSSAIRASVGGLRRIYIRMSTWLLILAVLVGLGVWFFSEAVVPWFLGAEWSDAARVMKGMALVAATRIVAIPYRSSLRVLERARMLIVVDTARLVLVAIALAVGGSIDLDPTSSLFIVFSALALSDVLAWLVGLRAVSVHDSTHWKGASGNVA